MRKSLFSPSASAPVFPYRPAHLVALLRRLSVLQKIGLGYTAAIGIALVGTAIGIASGKYLQRQAIDQANQAQVTADLLADLQIGILELRTHEQQLAARIHDPIEVAETRGELQWRVQAFTRAWKSVQPLLESASTPGAQSQIGPVFTHVQDQDQIVRDYLWAVGRVDDWVAPSQLINLTARQVTQQRLLQFSNSLTARRFEELSHELGDSLTRAIAAEQRAEAQLQEASQLSTRMIMGSLVLSAGIAILFAITTSRAIAQPIQRANDTARQVIADSNFELQAPVTTADEIGTLTESLNQLIRQVQVLLAEQEAASQQKLLESEKMSSLGRMLAGVAHEINNPINFVYGNIGCATEYVEDLFDLLYTYETSIPDRPAVVIDKAEDIDLEFLQADLPKLLASMRVGADRARQIVLSLRNFSRLDEGIPHPVNLPEVIDSTLLILNNRIKKGITLDRQFGQQAPVPEGYAGSLYQVFTNLIGNAIEALEEANPADPTIAIVIQKPDADHVAIDIRDNGAGIAPEHQARIFETFYTTKPAGVGTGLGLAISRQIVEDKHHGRLTFKSTVGVGTEFTILLPLRQPQPTPNATASTLTPVN